MLAALINLGGSLAIFAIVALTWWNLDKVLAKGKSEEFGDRIAGLKGPADWASLQEAAYAMMRRTVSPDVRFGRFLKYVLWSVGCGLAIALVAYFMSVPGFASQILGDGFAFRRVMRSIVLYGVPVAVACTYISFFLQGVLIASIRKSGVRGLAFYLVFDVAVRLAVYAVLSALVFAYFARFHGSFGGSVAVAVRVVPGTIASALSFSNIAGVYFYAAMFSSFPLFILLTLKIAVRSRPLQAFWRFAVDWIPIAEKPLRFGVLVLALFLATGAFASSLLFDAFAFYHTPAAR